MTRFKGKSMVQRGTQFVHDVKDNSRQYPKCSVCIRNSSNGTIVVQNLTLLW